ncbi:MAG: glycyl-radical enzyme activating protein [Clostridia bacterium]|nr:glycyl-radical enzyme activating protein [Clostridia bacterium]MBP3580854.1 glycyl-radical enzyme activating protein [Clostridia bacterium]
MELKITDIQTFCLHDGPGVRTTIFLAGCPLSCVWCHNPEARAYHPILVFDEKKCTYCGACSMCPCHDFTHGHTINRDACTLCGKCVENCKSGALSISQRSLFYEEYALLVDRQSRLTGELGGITFSGGEPLSQGKELIKFLDATPIHKAIETCGYADGELFSEVIKRTDLVMFDLKLADDTLHRKYTGVSNALILENLKRLRKSGKPFLLRTPLIPGITDTEENLMQIQQIVDGDPWEKLPYNPLTSVKYERIGMKYNIPDNKTNVD